MNRKIDAASRPNRERTRSSLLAGPCRLWSFEFLLARNLVIDSNWVHCKDFCSAFMCRASVYHKGNNNKHTYIHSQRLWSQCNRPNERKSEAKQNGEQQTIQSFHYYITYDSGYCDHAMYARCAAAYGPMPQTMCRAGNRVSFFLLFFFSFFYNETQKQC